MNTSAIATRRISTKKISSKGRPYYVSERVPVDKALPLTWVGCSDLFDPILKTKLPYRIEVLEARLQEILANRPADNRVFDPCTKRLLPNVDALIQRVKEIKCFLVKQEEAENKGANSLQLQLHQDIIVQGIEDRVQKEADKRFLIGVLPRGGKTYIAGGLIIRNLLRQRSLFQTILWITAAPNETKLQVEQDLIAKFDDFKEFQFVEVKEASTAISRSSGKPHVIYFMSSQLLSLVASGRVRSRPFLDALLSAPNGVDMMFFDEAHKTGTGAQTREQVERIQRLNPTSPIIFLTATYFNLQKEYKIPKSNTFLWDFVDVLSARKLASSNPDETKEAYLSLVQRYNKPIVDKVLTQRECRGESFATMIKSYLDYPDLYFLSADFNPDALDQFERAGIFTEEDGFDMGKLLKINDGATLDKFKTKGGAILADAFEQFDDIDLVSDFIELLGAYVIPRIDSISTKTGSRFKLSENPSLMMFLPTGRKGTNIFFTILAWSTALMAADWWNERYEVVAVVENETLPKDATTQQNNTTITQQSSIHIVSKNVKETIVDLEQRARSKGKGLIILAGEKLSMGVSLPFIDVVMMLNDKFSPDDIIQKMYRAVTPSPGKKTAFIVDFTPERTLTAVYGYTKAASPDTFSPAAILKVLLQTYYWDADIIPTNASERNHLLAHRNTFQGSLRKLVQNAVGNTGPKVEALEKEITRMQDHFLGQERKPREKLSLNYKNLVHPNNRFILNEYRTTFEQKQAALKTLQKQFRETPGRNKANELSPLLTNLRTYAQTFAEKIAETRKQRKALNSASTRKVKATVPTAAAAAKKAEKDRLKQEATNKKLAEKADKDRLKQEAAESKAREKADQALTLKARLLALKTEEAALKASLKASTTRKKKTNTTV